MALAPALAPPDPMRLAPPRWRQPRNDEGSVSLPGEMEVARWTSSAPASYACNTASRRGCHLVEVNLRPTDVVLYDGGDPVHDGPLPAGSVVLVAAGRPASAAYRAPCDLLQLFVPVELLEGLAGDYALPPFGVLSSPDPAVGRLALSLLAADELEGRAADLYSKGVAAAIVARLFGRAPTPAGLAAPARQGLLKWRLRRVLDYIEANLSEPMTLPDLAAAAGLSRMHFASQFRAATGLRPHDFVMRRRIERAEELLRDTALPLVEVALSVGFQTQAHFTTVFRALVLETPGRWRKLQLH